jgi:hypothetical protein
MRYDRSGHLRRGIVHNGTCGLLVRGALQLCAKGLAMPHKFKIGSVVNYYPKDRMLSMARGTYTITRLMPATEGKEPEYRIKHFSEEFERVAFEKELSA